MPRKCLDWITSYIEYTNLLESPTNYHLWSGMSMIAACLRRRVHVDMGYFKIYPNMYVVLVGPPGKCYSHDTEVLTDSGWKNIQSVSTSDLVLSIDATGRSLFMPVTDTQEVWVDEAVSFKQPGKIDLIVSPDHNMIVQEKHSGTLTLTPAINLIGYSKSTYLFPLTSKYEGELISSIYSIDSKVWMQFLGWFISEGNIMNNGANIKISQSASVNRNKYQEIVDIVDSIGLYYTKQKDSIIISTKGLDIKAVEELTNLGKCSEKYIPKHYFKLHSSLLYYLLETLIKGDGSISRFVDKRDGSVSTKVTYHTTSRVLAGDIQAIAQLIRLRATIMTVNNIDKTSIDSNGKIYTTKKLGYTVNINRSQSTKISKVETKVVPWRLPMYCLTTPLGSVYVRRNGVACWSGNCRKTAAINAAIGLIEDLSDVKMSADSITREALIKAIATAEAIYEEGPGQIRTHSSLTIISKELSVFLGTGNHDLLSLLTDLYDCPNRWEYKTKNQGTDSIKGVWLNMLGASTPDWLVGSMPVTAIGGGFTSRVVFVVEEDIRHKNPRPILTSKELKLREDLMYDLEDMTTLSGVMEMSKKGEKLYDQWYMNERSQIKDPRFHGYAERKPMHLLKVAQIMSASRGNDLTIEEVDLAIALNHLDRIEGRMIKAFGAAGRSKIAPDIDEVRTLIRKEGSIDRIELLNRTWVNVDPTALEIVIGHLKQMGAISVTISPEGRSVYTYIGEE